MESWEFGRMVRRCRERVAPATIGVPMGGRWRVPGLRREELAALAGISAGYLTRLEQGRATSPSAQVVEALARALRVSDTERDLLFRLAGHAAPGRDVVPSRITASVQRLLDRLAHTPVAVWDAASTLLVANAAYDAVMGDTTAWSGLARNSIWRRLVGPGNRVVHTPAEQADLADRALARLISELAARSPRFVELWESTGPDPTQETSRRKVIDHPAVAPIALDCDVLTVAADDVRIMVYTAEPRTGDAERLDFAIVLGTQSLVE